MDFKAATDALTDGPTHAEIAREMSVSVQTIRQARLWEGNVNRRPAPAGWRGALARIAHRRGMRLQELAAQLEREEKA